MSDPAWKIRLFGPAAVFEVDAVFEGARVALLQCRLCGAAVLADPRGERDFPRVHYEWHKKRAKP